MSPLGATPVSLQSHRRLLRCHSASCPARVFRCLRLPHPLQRTPFWGFLISTTISQTAAGVQQQQPAYPSRGGPEALVLGKARNRWILYSPENSVSTTRDSFRMQSQLPKFSWFAVRYTPALRYCPEWKAKGLALEEWYQKSEALLPILSQPWLEAELQEEQATGCCLSATHYISGNPTKVLAARMSKRPSTSTDAHLSTGDFEVDSPRI